MTEARCTRVGFHGFTIADAVAMRSYRHATGIPVGRLIAQACNPVVLALLRFSPRERPVIKGSLGKLPFFRLRGGPPLHCLVAASIPQQSVATVLPVAADHHVPTRLVAVEACRTSLASIANKGRVVA
jgi:hypothetical protein